MNYHFAPVQGHTDAPYRHFHNLIYGSDLFYYTPFIRLEDGKLRKRDIKDFTHPLNEYSLYNDSSNVPQIIFRDRQELLSLVTLMKERGADRLDLNMGCPFPLQTGHGRGAATVANETLGKTVADVIRDNPDIDFSVKIRLGMSDPDEWKLLLPHLNNASLIHLTVHPRIARQQYAGSLYLDKFQEILENSANPVVFNGDIRTPEDAYAIIERFPGISGIMIGRGAIGRPSIFREIIEGEEWSRDKRIEHMLHFHRNLFDHYSSQLCGDSQIISKIQPFWEYSEQEIGRKAWKAIKKAGNIAKYNSAVALIN